MLQAQALSAPRLSLCPGPCRKVETYAAASTQGRTLRTTCSVQPQSILHPASIINVTIKPKPNTTKRGFSTGTSHALCCLLIPNVRSPTAHTDATQQQHWITLHNHRNQAVLAAHTPLAHLHLPAQQPPRFSHAAAPEYSFTAHAAAACALPEAPDQSAAQQLASCPD